MSILALLEEKTKGCHAYTSHCNQPLYNMLNDYEFKEQEEED